MYCKSVGDPCDPLSFRWPTTKYAATQFWVATHGLRTQGLDDQVEHVTAPSASSKKSREDEATMSFIKPDESVLLARLKGEVYDMRLRDPPRISFRG